VVVVVCACVCVARCAARAPAVRVTGGAAAEDNLVVDTLNLVHWLRPAAREGPLDIDEIVGAIDSVAAPLRERYPGRVTFVVKSRDTPEGRDAQAATRARYQEAARRNRVWVALVAALPPRVGYAGRGAAHAGRGAAHAALGRDDFYMILTARDHGCAVLTRDRFRDLADMKSGALEPFHVYVFSPHASYPRRDFVNPAAAEYRRLCCPPAVRPDQILSSEKKQSAVLQIKRETSND
jgi:hypothetical protein